MSQLITGMQAGSNGTDNKQTLGNLQSVGPNTQCSIGLQSETIVTDQLVQQQTDQLKNQPQQQQQLQQQQQQTQQLLPQQQLQEHQDQQQQQQTQLQKQQHQKLQEQHDQQKQEQHQSQQQLSTQSQSQTVASSIHSNLHPKNQQLSSTNSDSTQFLTKTRLQDLVKEVDSTEQLDEDVEEMLLQLADDFVETTVNAACLLAKHRHANTVEVKDVQLHLERNWNMWIPGFGTDEVRPYKRATVTEAHKQRLALIRKSVKKY